MIKNLKINRPVKALLFLTLAFSLLTLNACKKEGTTDESFTASFTATVDGVDKVFNKNVVGATITSEGMQLTSMQGTAADGTIMSITLSGKLTAGKTYSTGATDDDDQPLIIYNVGDESYLNDDSAVGNLASVTLTSASATSVKGTFTGDLVEFTNGSDTKKKVITKGKFSVKLTTQAAK